MLPGTPEILCTPGTPVRKKERGDTTVQLYLDEPVLVLPVVLSFLDLSMLNAITDR